MHAHAKLFAALRATHPHTPRSRLRAPSVSPDTLGLASPLSLRAYDADMVSPIARHTPAPLHALLPYVTPPTLRDATPTHARRDTATCIMVGLLIGALIVAAWLGKL